MIKILFVPAGSITSASSRFRVYQFLNLLREEGFHIDVINYPQPPTKNRRFLFFTQLILASLQANIVFLQKRLFPRFFPLFWLANKKIIYDFDDALFGAFSAARESGEAKVQKRKTPYVNQILKLSTHIIAGNDYLAAYARQFNSNVSVIPTVVDISRYPLRQSQTTPDRPIVIGWVGNGENLIYLDDLVPVFLNLAKRFDTGIRFHIISDERPDFPSEIPLRFQPWQLKGEEKKLHAFDMGLMPLRDNESTRGKCAFKAIQYMAVGIPAIASPVGANKTLITHNVNGLLASTDEEWMNSLTRLIQDRQLRRDLGLAGRQTIVKHYSVETALPKLIDVLNSVAQT